MRDRIHPVILGINRFSDRGRTLIQIHKQVTGRCLNAIKDALRIVFDREHLYSAGRENAYNRIPYNKNKRTNCRYKDIVRYKVGGMEGNRHRFNMHKVSSTSEGTQRRVPCFKFCFQ